MTFPLQIRQLRRALDLTQAECAAILDVCPQSICNWEAGRSLPWEKDRGAYLAMLARHGHVVNGDNAPATIAALDQIIATRNGHNRSMGFDDTATINSPKLSETLRMRRRIGDML